MFQSIKILGSGILLIAFTLFVLLTPSCSGDAGKQGSQAGGARVVRAQGFRAEPQQFAIQIRATGELLSFEDVELRAPVVGNVVRIHFQEGQQVAAGALLVEIDNRTWEAQKRGLEAQLANARGELARREMLLEIEGISQESVDQSRTQVADLHARIDELAVRIDLAQIRAPFAGRLGMRDFSPGAYMAQGALITRLVQNQRLRVNFDIPARYASLAREGMMVQVISSSSRDTTTARIYAVEPVINAANRSLRLRGMLENGAGKYFPGDFVQVQIQVDESESALLIPSEAIISELNSQVVYIVRGGVARRTPVEIATSTRGRVNIINGIAPGDTVMITGLMGIRDGLNVQITQLNQEAGL